jgi:hypothetical protein
MVLNTNTTANGEVSVQTARSARFITGTFNLSHQAISMPNWENADVVREFGCYDPVSGSNNGVFWRNDSGTWKVIRTKNGSEVETILASNFTNSGIFVEDDSIHIYEIMYNAGSIFFLQDRKFLHKMSATTSAAYGTSHLKCGHKIYNTNSNVVDNKMISRGSSIGRIGSSNAVPNFKHISAAGTAVLKNNPGKLHRLLITDQGTGQSLVTIYNNFAASGEIIGVIDSNDIVGELTYNLEFDIGLTIVVAGFAVSLTVVFD